MIALLVLIVIPVALWMAVPRRVRLLLKAGMRLDTPRPAYTGVCKSCGLLRQLEHNLVPPRCRRCYERITAMML